MYRRPISPTRPCPDPESILSSSLPTSAALPPARKIPLARHHSSSKLRVHVTEIAHSAFSLLNTHQTRIDRADLGLAQEEDEQAEQQRDEDEGPVPRFPRGILRFELSDGLTTFRAIEFWSLPQLELGKTPLGYKVCPRSISPRADPHPPSRCFLNPHLYAMASLSSSLQMLSRAIEPKTTTSTASKFP